MKKIAILIAVIMVFAVFAGCTNGTQQKEENDQPQQEQQQSEKPQEEQQNSEQESEQSQEQQQNDEPQEESDEMHYTFEFEDINGKVHKLSDYEGKPVYLEIWGSWCSVCIVALEEMEAWAGEPRDYVVLSVVFPERSGEKTKEDFIAWYDQFGYENLIVLLDVDGQILSDFGIRAFPSQVFFDEHGNFEGGQVGQMPKDMIDETMKKIAEQK